MTLANFSRGRSCGSIHISLASRANDISTKAGTSLLLDETIVWDIHFSVASAINNGFMNDEISVVLDEATVRTYTFLSGK